MQPDLSSALISFSSSHLAKGLRANFCMRFSLTVLAPFHSLPGGRKGAERSVGVVSNESFWGRGEGSELWFLVAPCHLSSAMEPPEEPEALTYLSQADATAVDEALMGELGFSLDQLMELAGLSVASAVAEVYEATEYSRVLVLCGPGNNGGDGLVAARHLYHFGYRPTICYPKRTDKPIYHGLVIQLESLQIQFLAADQLPKKLIDSFDLVIDAMFGFSFHGIPRPPFDALLKLLVVPTGLNAADIGVPPVVAVDIPSGWHVEHGDIEGTGLQPDMLVSLTAPKLCAKTFRSPHHFLGGRFVPPAIAKKYGLKLPSFPGSSMCVRIGTPPKKNIATLRDNYIGTEFLEKDVFREPMLQFRKWFNEAPEADVIEPGVMTLATADGDGKPLARIVTLRGYNENGFIWCTDSDSRESQNLEVNPRASLVFYWGPLHRSVRITGAVRKLTMEEADQYFDYSTRECQIGALVSSDGTVIPGRVTLEDAYNFIQTKIAPDGMPAQRPTQWDGYCLRPDQIEFWQGRASRLHDRIQYTCLEGEQHSAWDIVRLAP